MKASACAVVFAAWAAMPSGAQSLPEFVPIAEGSYRVGTDRHSYNPRRIFRTEGYAIGRHEVTNAQFARFVQATGHVTTAERHRHAMVYAPGLREYRWAVDSTASWRHPQGRARYCVDTLPDHPVTCITLDDALAYCAWAGVRLPTFEEWEVAFRAGSRHRYHWGRNPARVRIHANVWLAPDHRQEDLTDGYAFTAPVGSFQPNAWGLYDMAGNVFELCDGRLPGNDGQLAHARGGSWWCSWNTCAFYNAEDIGRYLREAAFSNIGFRVVKDLPDEV
jgi:sulfatase modifying factor 1